MYKALIALAVVAVILPSTASAHTRAYHWSHNTPKFNCPKMDKAGKHCDELYLLSLKQA